ncbi:MAG: UDP-N-acetylglucosamine acyltransferase [Candidatus Methanofastidiosum methylothiophilum]|uniref:UDP-N-acetylglucosamine acyltransferase n=1 Tax=Candidatus Methanofastidiosum methylothiophilum TaxID=1705564 RepID=A0A150IR16_9EURY|nr:MAG: UDP-N-acetylglucosamine acyltransferase [Candidatus Methanofastidiosum methylthiophilus]KYC47423.1 MAG: UDP-N-acetylglucosamine acyltransferase [Candidatus Methanofastidiosum methylthiophilus]KYC49607.1 MAG: UDP-N-acetylglucosamine acyltransferase [Candidatus Methanofastidiosum methylthiophilus]
MSDYFVHETAEISKGATIGKNSKIWHQSQIREGAKIGENCIISKCVYIDFNVKIGNNVKIQNGVSVYHGVEVEDDVFLGPHMTFTNDLYPRAFNNNWELVSTLVKKGASIGANATIICGIIIGEYAMIGSGAVVTKNVPPYGLVFGNPAKLKGFVCKCGRKAVKLSDDKNKVLMECTICKTNFYINKEDYELLEE